MQRLLVICALGLGLTLAQGCATQDLPFASKSAASDAAAEGASPYQPERGTVRDGKSGAVANFGQGSPVPPTGYSTPPPAGYAAPPPGLPSSHEPYKAKDYGNNAGLPGGPVGDQPAGPMGEGVAPGKPKPVTTTPSGLKERAL